MTGMSDLLLSVRFSISYLTFTLKTACLEFCTAFLLYFYDIVILYLLISGRSCFQLQLIHIFDMMAKLLENFNASTHLRASNNIYFSRAERETTKLTL